MAFCSRKFRVAVEIGEAFPDYELLLEIHVVAIREDLIELFLISSERSLDLATQLRSGRLDADVLHPQL
jgi:hypothetical protein